MHGIDVSSVKKSVISIQDELLAIITHSRDGMSIRELSELSGYNRNTVARHLDLLRGQGFIEMRSYGRAKVYNISERFCFNTIQKIFSVPVIGLDRFFKIIEFNSYFENWSGKERKDLILKPFFTLELPLTWDQSFIDILRNQERKGSGFKRLEYYHKGKRYLIYFISVFYRTEVYGTAIVIQPHLKDVQLLDENLIWKTRYETFSDDIDEYVVHSSPEGLVTYANTAFMKATGLMEEEVINHSSPFRIYTEDIPHLSRNLSLITPDNPVIKMENRVIAPDGTVRWHSWKNRGIFIESTLQEIRSVGRDITQTIRDQEEIAQFRNNLQNLLDKKTEELRKINQQLILEIDKRKNIERELSAQTTKLKNINRYIVDYQIETDRNLQIISCNRPIKLNNPETIIGSSLLEFVPYEYTEHFLKIVNMVLESESPYAFETFYPEETGSKIHICVRIIPNLSSKKISSLFFAISDISSFSLHRFVPNIIQEKGFAQYPCHGFLYLKDNPEREDSSSDLIICDMNAVTEDIIGISVQDGIGRSIVDVCSFMDDDWIGFFKDLKRNGSYSKRIGPFGISQKIAEIEAFSPGNEFIIVIIKLVDKIQENPPEL